MGRSALLVVVTVALATSACGSFSLLSGSRTVPRHAWEVAALAGYSVQPPQLSAEPPANVEVLGRFGLSDRLDLGLRLFTVGGAVEGRFQLYVSPEEDQPGVSALMSLSVGVRSLVFFRCGGFDCVGSTVALPFIQLRVPVGVRFGWFELIVGPHFALESFGEPLGYVGGDLALVAHLPRGFSVGPEVAMLFLVSRVPQADVRHLVPLEPRAHFGFAVFKTF